MSTMVPMYGFGGGGGKGAALTVNAPAGVTVTVSKDGKSKTKVADTDGVAVFRGLATGQWTLSITDGEQTAQKTVTITADYTAAITFFAATIHVTYPAGSTCTATDGTTTLTAPDTSGTWDCVVPNAGMWNVLLDSGFAEAVEVTTNGETYTVDKWHLYNRGDQKTGVTGGWAQGKYDNLPAGNVTFNDSDILLNTAKGYSSFACTTNKIKIISGTLCVKGTYNYGACLLYLGLFDGITNGSIKTQGGEVPIHTGENVLKVDVSGFIGTTFNAAVFTFANTQNGGINIDEVWMEV